LPLAAKDLEEIEKISRRKSVRRISRSILKDLDNETLSLIIAAYLELKANGHTDSDFLKYLSKKSQVLKLGVKACASILPAMLADPYFTSLAIRAIKELNAEKKAGGI
jgi:hypothetical protein